MSFQENKFPILLGAITALATGGLIYWGMKSSGRYEQAKLAYDGASSTISTLMRKKIEPTPANLQAKKSAVEAYAESVQELQQAFDPLRRPELQNIAPSEYTDALLETRQRIRAEYTAVGAELPKPFFVGHTKFSDTLPARRDTGVLKFELEAFEDLLLRLAAAKPASLDNVYWPGIPEVPQGATSVAHPLEVTFTGSESSLRKFLESLDASDRHYFVIRSMRVSNARGTAPNSSDARFETSATAGSSGLSSPADQFEAFFDDEGTEDTAPDDGPGDDDAVPAEAVEVAEPVVPADEGEILKQVLGEEKIHVFLRIDVMQFLEPLELPSY
jgi:hypothetical protein